MTKLSRRGMVTVGAWALAFLVAHLVGYTLPDVQQTITVWPAAGVGLAALLLSPRALWPWLLSAFVVVGIGGDVAIAHRPFAAAVGYMTANFVEATASALLIRRVGGRNIRFDRVAPVVALLGSAFGVNAISACIGAGSSALAAHGVFGDAWRTWYVADALGILLVTPLIIGWARVHDLGEADASARPGRTVESVAFFGVWCVLAWYAFSPSAGSAVRPYVLVALLPWPAFRLRPLA